MDGSNGAATCVCLANGTGLPGAASGAGQTLCDEGLPEEDGGAAELHPILIVGEAGDEPSPLSPKILPVHSERRGIRTSRLCRYLNPKP